MRPQLQANFDRVENHIAQKLAIHISETLIGADSPYSLGWVVRAELKRQLTPFSDDFRRVSELLDQTANFVSHQAHNHNIFQSEDHVTSQTHVPIQSLTNTSRPKVPMGTSQGVVTHDKSSMTLSNLSEKVQFHSRKVPLFSTFHYIKTILGILVIQVASYRLSNSKPGKDTKHFRLKITFLPDIWLSFHGFSLAYSSGPDNMGFYDILPRIQVFSIHKISSPLFDIILEDDLEGFMKMLQERSLSLGDRDLFGRNLLLVSKDTLTDSILAGAEYMFRFLSPTEPQISPDIFSMEVDANSW